MHIKFRPVGYLVLTAIMAVILTCPLTARADSAVEWNNKGNDLYMAGRYQEAISCYDRALELDPKDADAWNNKAIALIGLGRYQEAIDCIDTALGLNDKIVNPYAWSSKGWVLNKMGMTPIEVLECYEKALAIDPKHVPHWSKDRTPLAETPEYKQAKGAVDGK